MKRDAILNEIRIVFILQLQAWNVVNMHHKLDTVPVVIPVTLLHKGYHVYVIPLLIFC